MVVLVSLGPLGSGSRYPRVSRGDLVLSSRNSHVCNFELILLYFVENPEENKSPADQNLFIMINTFNYVYIIFILKAITKLVLNVYTNFLNSNGLKYSFKAIDFSFKL